MLHDILVNYLLPLLIYGFVTGLANLALAHKSQIETWSESHPKYAGFLKLMRAVGFDPWSLVAALSLWAKKRLPDAQQNGAKAVAQLRAASVRTVPLPLDETEPTPPWRGPSSGSGLALLFLACCVALTQNSCALFKGPVTPKSIDSAAVILCDTFFSARKPGISFEDIEKAFCSTARDLEPFLLAAKRAQEQGGAVAVHRSESAQ